MSAYLSPAQQKKLDERRAPKRHAMDRLIERHMPLLDDKLAEQMIDLMIQLCGLAHKIGRDTNTARLVNKETDTSMIYDLDMFEDRKTIRVCYDPVSQMIRTVLP